MSFSLRHLYDIEKMPKGSQKRTRWEGGSHQYKGGSYHGTAHAASQEPNRREEEDKDQNPKPKVLGEAILKRGELPSMTESVRDLIYELRVGQLVPVKKWGLRLETSKKDRIPYLIIRAVLWNGKSEDYEVWLDGTSVPKDLVNLVDHQLVERIYAHTDLSDGQKAGICGSLFAACQTRLSSMGKGDLIRLESTRSCALSRTLQIAKETPDVFPKLELSHNLKLALCLNEDAITNMLSLERISEGKVEGAGNLSGGELFDTKRGGKILPGEFPGTGATDDDAFGWGDSPKRPTPQPVETSSASSVPAALVPPQVGSMMMVFPAQNLPGQQGGSTAVVAPAQNIPVSQGGSTPATPLIPANTIPLQQQVQGQTQPINTTTFFSPANTQGI